MSTDQLRQSLIDQIEQGRLPLTEGLQWIAELERLERAAQAAAATPQGCSDIAVIGMSGRFPGAPDVNRFATNLAAGVDAVREVPADRWSLDDYYDPDPAAPNRTACKWGGFLDQIDQFDPLFFRIAPKEAEIMDPQQRLFLETAWSALEDAGYSDRDLSGRRCGVFVGAAGGDFGRKVERYGIEVTSDTFFGNTPSLLPSRICYFLNLKGSALTLDTACSSSLVATHLACKSLIAGDNDMMIAGGVCVINTESLFVMLSKNGMLSPSGRCRAFDDGADGMVLAEGVGAVVLKRLDRALADGDRIDAVIKGSAINQDGTTNGIAAPCGPSQTKLEQQVYQNFNIDPATIEMVEAHGTGTPLGDPIELRALHDAFRQSTDRKAFCAIGSVKTNIGHAQTAAGIASLIKVVLALRTRTIFPTLHVQQETRRFNFAESPFYVAQQAKPWRRDDETPRRAAVSSFGASGTNCHLVLEEAPTVVPNTRAPRVLWPVVISAKRREGLRETAALWHAHLTLNTNLELGDVAFTACVGRSHFRYRAAFLVRDSDELRARLQAFAQGDDQNAYLGDPESAADGIDPLQVLDTQTLATVLADDLRAAALLEQVLAWFVTGGDPEWPQLFADAACRRVALPTYPFHRRSYWPTGSGSAAGQTDSALLGSFLDQNHSDLSRFRFTKTLKRDAFYLDEHRVDGTRVLPGVTYLEMALQAAGCVAPRAGCHTIQRHTWVAPVQVTRNPVTITLSLEARADGFDYRVTSPYGGRPVLHAQGRLTTNPNKPPQRYQPVGATATWIDGKTFYQTLTASGMLRGPRFQTVRRFAILDDALHAELELPLDAAAEFGAFHLHPGLADGLLQCAAPLLQDNSEDDAFWLPFSLGRLSLFAPLEKELRVIVRRESDHGRVRSFAVSVFSTSGGLLAEIGDYRVRRLTQPTATTLPKPPVDLTFISRVGSAIAAAQAPASAPLVWITDDGRAPNNGAVTAALPARDLERLPDLLNDAPFNNNSDLHLIWRANGDAAPQAVAPFLLRLHALAQTLTKIKHKTALVVAVSERTPLLIAAASFLRVLSAENRKVQCRLVFLAEDTVDETQRLIDEIPSAGHSLPEVSYRAGVRYATALQQRSAAELASWQNDRYRTGGVYLVTGGRGGVGRQLVAYLLQHLKARVLVIGRSQPDPVTASWFDELAARGGAWRFEAADVADTNKLKSLVADVHNAFGALHGVFHCAGVTRDAMLAKKNREDFEAVLRPKIDGTIALHEALANHPLDFLALFSSSGSMIANPGQADYAAANRFLDAFASWRNKRVSDGLCHGHTLALSWPLWAEGGMRLPEKAAAALEKRVGMRALESNDGMAALRLALAGECAHFGVFYGDTARIVAALAAEPAADSPKNNDPTQIVDSLAHAWVTHILNQTPALPATATAAGARTFAVLQQLCNRPDHHRPSRELAEEKSPLAFTGVNVDGDRLVAHTQQLEAQYPAQREPLALFAATARHLPALLGGADAAPLLAAHAPQLARVSWASLLAECCLFGFLPEYWSLADAGRRCLPSDQRRQLLEPLATNPAPATHPTDTVATGKVDRAAVSADLTGVISRLTKVGLEDLDPHGDLSDYGMDSVVLTELANHINDNYGTEWTPADFFEFASIAAFVEQLCNQLGETPSTVPTAVPPPAPSTVATTVVAPVVAKEAPLQHADSADLSQVVADLLAGEISRAMKIPLEEVDLHGDLSDYGFDSVTLTELANLLNDLWDTDLSAATFFEFESIGAFARFLVDTESERIAAWHRQSEPKTAAPQATVPAPANQNAAPVVTPPPAAAPAHAGNANLIDLNQPIAVIGKSAVFPGDNDLETWWQKILNGDFMVGEIPKSRFDWRAFFGDAQLEGEKLHSCWGGFIDEIDKFDAEFFKISPREAALMDPQHRLFLELTWRAIEDAAIAPRSLAGSRTGVFVGVTNNDYSEILAEQGLGADAHAPTGNAHCLVPNRISYLLNFKGPSEPTDTACSSSLVAIHRAVRALQTGECSLAVAGGINVLLSPSAFIAFSKSGNMLARDGRCKTFDAGADGYVRGEGAGAVVLKTLADARRDGDPIYAVIRGTAINHGGHAASLTAPNPNAQAELLVDAYRQADFAPQQISHIEVHGTGTQLGDPIEINGLKKAFAQLAEDRGTALDQASCGLSSIKSNIGHLEGAAGVAGFIKILLAMRDRRLPKTLHFNQLNPNIRMQGSPFYIINEPRSWQPRPGSSQLCAGVSSFGFGGANAHVALESHDEYRAPAAATRGPHLFVFSANKAASLRDLLGTFKTWLTSAQGRAADCADIAHTLQVGRDAMRVRLAFTASDKNELLQQIDGFLTGTDAATRAYSGDKPPRIANPATLTVTAANLAEAVQRFAAGDNLDVAGLGQGARRIHLPTYHFLRKRHWAGEGPGSAPTVAKRAAPKSSAFAFAAEDLGDEEYEQDTPEAAPGKSYGPFKPMNANLIESQKSGANLSQRKRAYLAAFTEHFCAKNAASKQHAQQHRDHYADQRAVAFFHPTLKELCFPLVMDRCEGAEIWDIDGNHYVDIAMDFGCNLFGHRAPFLVKAMEQQLQRGLALGMRPPSSSRAAELLCRLTGHERAVFTQSGTEAVMTAIRLARHATGRKKIVIFANSYHGHSDGVLAYGMIEGQHLITKPIADAIPPGMVKEVVVLDYNAPASLNWIRNHRDQLAAVVSEPMQSRGLAQRPGAFLRELRRVTEAADVALIFDEMITGFRVHPGGSQAYFGVRADLCTYGKILGGGIGQGAVAGKKRFLDAVDGGFWQYGDESYPPAERTFFAGTHSQNALGMAAAEAVLRRIEQVGPTMQETLNAVCADMAARINQFFQTEEVPLMVQYFGSLFRFEPNGPINPIDQSLFVYSLRDKGIMISEIGNNFLSTAHTPDHIDRIVATVADTIADLRQGGYLPRRKPARAPIIPDPPYTAEPTAPADDSFFS